MIVPRWRKLYGSARGALEGYVAHRYCSPARRIGQIERLPTAWAVATAPSDEPVRGTCAAALRLFFETALLAYFPPR
jgi:hypothetical protein